MFRREPVVLVLDAPAELEPLDVRESVMRLDVGAGILALFVEDRAIKQILVHEDLFARRNHLVPPVRPDEDQLVERRTLEHFVSAAQPRTEVVVLLVPADGQFARRERADFHLLERTDDLGAARVLVLVLFHQSLEVLDRVGAQPFEVRRDLGLFFQDAFDLLPVLVDVVPRDTADADLQELVHVLFRHVAAEA